MNVFCIPSWYPSHEYPLYGIFIKEQMLAISRNHSDINIGISFWGQGSEKHLLWTKDHFFNLKKVVKHSQLKPDRIPVKPNYIEYYTPALIWTRKLLSGNNKNIIQANLNNFRRFEEDFGKVNLIHVQAGYPGGLIAHHMSSELGLPYIITARMSPFPFAEFIESNGSLSTLIAKPFKHSSCNIAISESLGLNLKSIGFPNVKIINNLVDDDFFVPEESRMSDAFQFITIGRLVEQKGIDILLQAFSMMKNSDSHLTIAGTGVEQKQLQALGSSLKLERRIRWAGDLNREQIRKLIQSSNCVVLASRHETFGNVLTEATACGKPIISTKCGGPEDIVSQVNGLLAEIDNPADLANQMDRMIDNYENYSSQDIRDDCISRFSSKVITPKIVQVYKNL